SCGQLLDVRPRHPLASGQVSVAGRPAVLADSGFSEIARDRRALGRGPCSTTPANGGDFRFVAGNPVRVLVADCDASVGDRVERAMQRTPGLSFVGHASTGDEAIALVGSESPDVAFVACDMPGAAAATQTILRLTPTPPRIVVMSAKRSPPNHQVDRTSRGRVPDPIDVSGYVATVDDDFDVFCVVAALSPLTAPAGAAGLRDQKRLVCSTVLRSTGLPSLASEASTASIIRTTSNPI